MSGLLCDTLGINCAPDTPDEPPARGGLGGQSITVGEPVARLPPTSTPEERTTRSTAREVTVSSTSEDETTSTTQSVTRSTSTTSSTRSVSSSVQTSETTSDVSSEETASIALPTLSQSLTPKQSAALANEGTSKADNPTLGAGPIIGIAAAGIVALIFFSWLLMYCCKRRRRARDHEAIASWSSVEDLGGAGGRSSSPAPLVGDRDSDSAHSHSSHKPMSEMSSAIPPSLNSPRQPLAVFAPPPPPPTSSFRGPMDRAACPYEPAFVHQQHFPPAHVPPLVQIPYAPPTQQQPGRTDYAFASAMMGR